MATPRPRVVRQQKQTLVPIPPLVICCPWNLAPSLDVSRHAVFPPPPRLLSARLQASRSSRVAACASTGPQTSRSAGARSHFYLLIELIAEIGENIRADVSWERLWRLPEDHVQPSQETSLGSGSGSAWSS